MPAFPAYLPGVDALEVSGAVDNLHGNVTISLPDASLFSDPAPDRWQIIRHRGLDWTEDIGGSTWDYVADLPAGRRTWIDRNPYSYRTTYLIRGRIRAQPEQWGPWSSPMNISSVTPLHSTISSPFNSLELRVLALGETNPAAVEQARGIRYNVQGTPTYELDVDFRAAQTVNTNDVFRIGFRWYTRDGICVGQSYDEVILDYIDGQSQTGRLQHRSEPVPRAAKMGIFMEIASAGTVTTSLRVRVENIELYRYEADHDSGWEYLQVPSVNGLDADTRFPEVDQTVFAYDGIGWSPLTPPPDTSVIKAPYRQTSTPDDVITFLTNGNFVDLLFYGHTAPAVIAIERLIDSPLGKVDPAGQEGISLWEPITSADFPIATPVYGSNLVLDSNAENGVEDLDGWETYQSNPERTTVYAIPTTEPSMRVTTVRHNGLYAVGSTLITRQVGANKITGTASYEVDLAGNQGGVAYPFIGGVFKAGETYRATFKIRKVNGAHSYYAILGSSTPVYYSPTTTTDYYQDDFASIQIALTDVPTTYTVTWTPKRDTDTAYFALRHVNNSGGLGASDRMIFDDVVVQQHLGYQIPAGVDFAPVRIGLPGIFSPRHATPYRVRVVSGVVRPYGVVRDPANTIDLKQDFTTYLRALGDVRNLSLGELEFRPDHKPPTVYHHARRGRNHKTLKNGLQILPGKNIISRKRSTSALNITNRLIVVGYGDDRTQLVYEARALKDAKGRLPSDPAYLIDENGVHRDDVIATNYVKNPSLRESTFSWQVTEGVGFTPLSNHNAWEPFIPDSDLEAGAWRTHVTTPDATARTTGLINNLLADQASAIVAPGELYTMTCMVYVVTNTPNATFRIDAFPYDQAFGALASQTGVSKAITLGWNFITQTFVMPANTAWFRMNPEFRVAGAGTLDGYITQMGLWRGSPPDFFDGSTHDATRWTGTPNASSSELLAKDSIWDAHSGGTSEDVYGVRYGIYRESQLTTLYQAQVAGQEIVEASAWPTETFEISIADLNTIPAELQPGDTISFPYNGRTFSKRLIEITHDMAKPRALELTLGDDSDELTKPIERITRDVETAISALNNAG